MLRASVAAAVMFVALGCNAGAPASPLPAPSLAPSSPPASPTTSASSKPFAIGAFPAAPSFRLPTDTATSLQRAIDKARQRLDAPGMAAGVILAGRGDWAGATGTSDGRHPLDPAAQFGIGSVTKTVVAAQVLELVESGQVDLDRPIAAYLTGHMATNGATVRQVLGMRSGVGDPAAGPDLCYTEHGLSVSMAEIRAVPLGDPFFEAGSGFRYTNSNYDLAGAMIEDVTHKPLADVLRTGVLSTPGLERLVYQDAEHPTPPVAAPFVVVPGLDAVPSPTELLEAGGGYLPTRCLASSAGPAGAMAADALTLARWGYLLYGGSVLGEDALQQMTTVVDGYGLGLHQQPPSGGTQAIGHEGTVPGYISVLQVFPEDGIAVAVLINTNGGDENDLVALARNLRDLVIGS